MKHTKNSRKRKENITGYLFIAPIMSGFLIFVLLPVVVSLALSFCKWNFLSGFKNITFVGFRNFSQLLTDQVFIESFKNTIVFAMGTILLQVCLSLVIAVVLTSKIMFRGLFKTMIFTPYITSMVAAAIVWKTMLHPTMGPVNNFLRAIGVEHLPRWFASVDGALPTLILFTAWQSLGYFTIVYISGLKSIPNELYEAATIDGAGVMAKFFRITVPLVSPTTFFLVVTGLIGCFRAFDQISVTTNGGPGNASSVIVVYVYKHAFEFYKMGYASSAAWLLFILVFSVTAFQWIGQKKWVNYD